MIRIMTDERVRIVVVIGIIIAVAVLVGIELYPHWVAEMEACQADADCEIVGNI